MPIRLSSEKTGNLTRIWVVVSSMACFIDHVATLPSGGLFLCGVAHCAAARLRTSASSSPSMRAMASMDMLPAASIGERLSADLWQRLEPLPRKHATCNIRTFLGSLDVELRPVDEDNVRAVAKRLTAALYTLRRRPR